MATHRFPRLEAVLGEPVGPGLSATAVGRFVEQGAAEDDQLDFKRVLYPHDDEGKAELAKDVCAFANHQGGVVVLGVADAKGVATRLAPVRAGDPERRWMRTVVFNHTAPMPDFELVEVPAEEGGCFLLVVVPASPRAPHAVSPPNDDRFLYPVRYGSQARYLREVEVAAAYRDRVALAQGQLARLEAAHAEGLARLRTDAQPWLAVSLVPDVPGAMALGSRTLREFAEWAAARGYKAFPTSSLVQAGSYRATAGVRRVVLQDPPTKPRTAAPARLAESFCAELHTDGTGFAAATLEHGPGEAGGVLRVYDESVVCKAVALVQLLCDHAQEHAGVRGDAVVRAGLVEPNRGLTSAGTTWVELAHDRRVGGPHGVPDTRWVLEGATSRHTLSVDAVATSTAELLAAGRAVAADVLADFGLAEPAQLGPGGAVRIAHFGARRQAAVRAWAERFGAALDEGIAFS